MTPALSLPRLTLRRQPEPTFTGARALTLVCNTTCNLRCDYCYVRPAAKTDLELEDALVALGLCVKKGPVAISFFGGEPMLSWHRLVAPLTEYWAWARRGEARFYLTTNGTLIGQEEARFLARYDFGVILSLDGPQELHDRHRKLPDGRGSYAAARRGLSHLRDAGLGRRTTLRATFLADELRLATRLEHLNALCDAGYAAHVSVEPAFLSEGPCARGKETRMVSPEDEARLRRAYRRAGDWALLRRAAGLPARFHHFDVFLRRLRSGSPALAECGAGCGYLAVAPGGDICACHRLGDTRIGHTRRDPLLDPEKQRRWQETRLAESREHCRQCAVRDLCGGGCRSDALQATGDLNGQVPALCLVKRIIIEECRRLLQA